MESKSKLNSLEQGIVDGLLERKGPDLLRLLEEQTESQTCCYQSLLLDGHELLDMSDLVFVKLMLEPDKCLHKLDSLLAVALTRLRESNPGPPVDRVHLRIRSLPDLPEFQRQVVPRSEDIGSLISLAGTVTKTGPTKMVTTRKVVSCNKCRHTFHVHADYEQESREEFLLNFSVAAPGCLSRILIFFRPRYRSGSSNNTKEERIKINCFLHF
jgi:DNA replicative helicase MCM subunit Mcm2 (Cdc46/Mcm family)